MLETLYEMAQKKEMLQGLEPSGWLAKACGAPSCMAV
jgi:hypothetical protein